MQNNDLEELWVADASVMPNITSANTNVPSTAIGHSTAKFVVAAMRRLISAHLETADISVLVPSDF